MSCDDDEIGRDAYKSEFDFYVDIRIIHTIISNEMCDVLNAILCSQQSWKEGEIEWKKRKHG